MTLTFREVESKAGNICVDWTADTPREWQRALQALKRNIPKEGREYEAAKKRWVINRNYVEQYEKAKNVALGLDQDIENYIDDLALLEAFGGYGSAKLPESMKRRALIAIKRAIGLLEGVVEFSIHKQEFGTFNEEEGVWVYSDGSYSQYSPAEMDARVKEKAHDRLENALERFPTLLDNQLRQYEINFRYQILRKYQYTCYVCGKNPANTSNLHMHRVLPGKLGGEYVEENVVLVCAGCHKRVEGLSWEDIENKKAEYEQ